MTRLVNAMVAQLSGPALDWAVGLAVAGKPVECSGSVPRWKFTMLEASVWAGDADLGDIERYSPSTVWDDGGPLISKYGMQFTTPVSGGITAWPYGRPSAATHGPDHLVAACRAIVVAELGEVISVPAELLDGGAAC